MRQPCARISLLPRVAGLLGPLEVSRSLQIVVNSDKELLLVAGAVPQLIGSAGVLRRKDGFTDVAVHAPEGRVGTGEVGINLDGALEKGHRASRTRCKR